MYVVIEEYYTASSGLLVENIIRNDGDEMENDGTIEFLQEALLKVIKDKFETVESPEEANELIEKIKNIDLADFCSKFYSEM